jgi:hypothetical protein
MAAHHFTAVSEDPDALPSMKDMNAALLSAAEGDWAQAGEILSTNVLAENPDNYVVRHHLSRDPIISERNSAGSEQPVRRAVEPGKVKGGAWFNTRHGRAPDVSSRELKRWKRP